MEYNAKKYYNGTKYMNEVNDLINDIHIFSEEKFICSKFEYKSELNKILNDITSTSLNSISICNTIDKGRYNISKFDPVFENAYYVEEKYDLDQNYLNGINDSDYFVDYTNEELYEILKNEMSEENIICLKQFNNLFNDDMSNKDVVEQCNKAFIKEILNGNKDVEKLLKAIIKLKMENPDLEISLSTDGSYYSSYYKEIAISDDILKMNNTSTIFHEMGHAFHNLITNNEINTDVTEMIKNAKNNKESNGNMTELYDWFAYKHNEINNNVEKDYYDQIMKETGMNQEEYFQSLVNKYNTIRNNKIFEELYDYVYGDSTNDEILKQLDIDIDTAHLILGEYYSSEELASQYIFDEINARVEAEERESGLAAMHDIIDAVYQGEYYDMTQISSDGTVLNVYGHGSDYYNSDDNIYAELIANYTDLKTSGNEEAINKLKEVFGETFLNEVDEIYNSFTEYGNYTQI